MKPLHLTPRQRSHLEVLRHSARDARVALRPSSGRTLSGADRSALRRHRPNRLQLDYPLPARGLRLGRPTSLWEASSPTAALRLVGALAAPGPSGLRLPPGQLDCAPVAAALLEAAVADRQRRDAAAHCLGLPLEEAKVCLSSARSAAPAEKGAICGLVRHAPAGTVVLFEDETILREFPPLRAGWAVAVPISGSNARRSLFATLNPKMGQVFQRALPNQKASSFQAFLRALRARYRRWCIWLILDRHSAHRARGSLELASQLRIWPIWLPVACPEDNPLEGLWRVLTGGRQSQLWNYGRAGAASL